MIYNRKIYKGIYLTAICVFLSGCTLVEGEVKQENYEASIRAEEHEIIYPCTKADMKTDAEDIAEVDLSTLTEDFRITDAGSYMLTGDYNGQIYIEAEEQVVHLFLKDVNIYSLSGPAINAVSAGKVIITLVENTENTIRDSAHYRGSDKRDATVYSDCDLTINGSGSLNAYGFYNDAIHSKGIIKILGNEVFVRAKGNGIQGNDGILIDVTQLKIECEGNGLYTTKTGKGEKGTVDIYGGQISIIAGKYAINSAKDLYIRNCAFWSNSVLDELNIAGEEYFAEGCIENG